MRSSSTSRDPRARRSTSRSAGRASRTLIPLTVARDEINIVTVRTAFMIAPGTGYVRLQDFSETTDQEMARGAEEAGRRRACSASSSTCARTRAGRIDARDRHGEQVPEARPDDRLHARPRRRIPTSTRARPRRAPIRPCRSSCSSIATARAPPRSSPARCRTTTAGSSSARRPSARPSCSPSIRSATAPGLALTTAHYYTPSGRVIQRPWDASFDDYLTYKLRDQNGNAAASGVRTASHRRRPQVSTAAAGSSRITSSRARSRASRPSRFMRAIYNRGVVHQLRASTSPRKATRGRPPPSAAASHRVAQGLAGHRRHGGRVQAGSRERAHPHRRRRLHGRHRRSSRR